ncbi:hypothetical protein ZIOFF_067533 [Zingiber officinale]|uniref:CG-1 domain-containing protein n=1 Tax=Zingiber officinale TaxID=94328 RepID=A0A8J5CFU8_ZINOF|nr:hypothetical protein ZIOFF_067533 [Zingiber officinale]
MDMAGVRRGEANASFAGVLVFYALKSQYHGHEVHWEHYNPNIEQLLVEAQHRWLRPAEICEILQNHRKFRIAPEPPNKPQSGSLFLFDRKVLRYFRKDGHNWRKKKDGKTVKEAHERLKVALVLRYSKMEFPAYLEKGIHWAGFKGAKNFLPTKGPQKPIRGLLRTNWGETTTKLNTSSGGPSLAKTKTTWVISKETPHVSFFKRLTGAEMAERCTKGHCFNWDESYSTGHKCKRLFWIEMSDDDTEGEEEGEVDSKISLHAISGVIPRLRTSSTSRGVGGK